MLKTLISVSTNIAMQLVCGKFYTVLQWTHICRCQYVVNGLCVIQIDLFIGVIVESHEKICFVQKCDFIVALSRFLVSFFTQNSIPQRHHINDPLFCFNEAFRLRWDFVKREKLFSYDTQLICDHIVEFCTRCPRGNSNLQSWAIH